MRSRDQEAVASILRVLLIKNVRASAQLVYLQAILKGRVLALCFNYPKGTFMRKNIVLVMAIVLYVCGVASVSVPELTPVSVLNTNALLLV